MSYSECSVVQVLQVGKQLHVKESDYTVVLYEVLQVSEQVSVILWSYHQRRYKTFGVYYYQSVLWR